MPKVEYEFYAPGPTIALPHGQHLLGYVGALPNGCIVVSFDPEFTRILTLEDADRVADCIRNYLREGLEPQA